eukprot:2459975-Rhodomonas_salina.1
MLESRRAGTIMACEILLRRSGASESLCRAATEASASTSALVGNTGQDIPLQSRRAHFRSLLAQLPPASCLSRSWNAPSRLKLATASHPLALAPAALPATSRRHSQHRLRCGSYTLSYESYYYTCTTTTSVVVVPLYEPEYSC